MLIMDLEEYKDEFETLLDVAGLDLDDEEYAELVDYLRDLV